MGTFNITNKWRHFNCYHTQLSSSYDDYYFVSIILYSNFRTEGVDLKFLVSSIQSVHLCKPRQSRKGSPEGCCIKETMLELVCFLRSRKSRFKLWWGQVVGIILFLHHEKSKSTLVEFLRCWKGLLLPLFKSAPQEGLKITKLTEGLYSAYANYYLHWKDLWKHVSFGLVSVRSFFFPFLPPNYPPIAL